MNSLKQFFTTYKTQLLKIAAIIGSLILGAICHRYGIDPRVVEKIVEVPAKSATDEELMGSAPPAPRYGMGWRDDQEQVEQIKKGLRYPKFSATPAGQVVDLPDHCYLWDASLAALGHHVPARNQGQVGSCTAFGSTCASEYLQVLQIVQALKAGQPAPTFKDLAQETLYGIGRVLVMRDVNDPEDGATGASMAQASRDYGVVARGVYGSYDLSKYVESVCKKFGYSGTPSDLVTLAKQHPVHAISPVTTVAELQAALASGYPVTVASNIGFGMTGPYVRDQNGFLRARGSWPHQMCFIGYQTGATPGFYIMNSWGPDWVSGPTGPGNPPPGGFWVNPRTAQVMLNAQDSFAYSSLQDFPAQTLDWNIRFNVPCHQHGDIATRFDRVFERALAW